MMIARWQIDAKFGHKPEVMRLAKKWMEEIGSKIGWTAERTRILSGSVGACESTVISEIQIKDLAELNDAWNKLATIDAHAKWSKELEPYIVSGTNRWEIFRVV